MWKFLLVLVIVIVAVQAAPQAAEEKPEPVIVIEFIVISDDQGIIFRVFVKKNMSFCEFLYFSVV